MGKKGLQIDIALRPGLRWTDGAPVTASDVAATFAAMADRRDHSAYFALFGVMRDVQAAGPERLTITLARPDTSFLHAVLRVPIAPAKVLRPLIGRTKALARNAELNVDAAITAGPFRLTSWNRDTGTLRFVRNVSYPWGQARLGSLTLQYYATADAAWQAFVAGRVAIANVPSDADAQAAALAKAGKARLRHLRTSTYTYVAFNMNDPIWAQADVRRAAVEAVDRKAIAAQLPVSPGTATGGPPPLSLVARGGDMGGLAYNLTKARALLTAAGWVVGANGVRYKSGQPLSFTLLTVAGVPLWDRYIGIVAYDLRLAGFEVAVEYQTFASLSRALAEPPGSHGPGAWALAWTMTPGSDARTLFGGRTAFPPGGQNVGAYEDPTVTQALNRLAVGGSAGALRTARRSLRTALASDPPAIFLYRETGLLATAPGLHLPAAAAATGTSLNWPQDWYETRP